MGWDPFLAFRCSGPRHMEMATDVTGPRKRARHDRPISTSAGIALGSSTLSSRELAEASRPTSTQDPTFSPIVVTNLELEGLRANNSPTRWDQGQDGLLLTWPRQASEENPFTGCPSNISSSYYDALAVDTQFYPGILHAPNLVSPNLQLEDPENDNIHNIRAEIDIRDDSSSDATSFGLATGSNILIEDDATKSRKRSKTTRVGRCISFP